MLKTRAFCDRCGKEVGYDPLKLDLYQIIFGRRRYTLRFPEAIDKILITREVCRECLSEFNKWWKEGERDG